MEAYAYEFALALALVGRSNIGRSEQAARKDASDRNQSFVQCRAGGNIPTRPGSKTLRDVNGAIHVRYHNYWRIIT